MNKTHRVVWSAARGAFVVAHEFAASAGKRSSRKSIIAQSIGAAAFVVLATPGFAQTTITGATGSQTLIQLTPPESLVVTNTGTITAYPASGYAGVTGSTITAAGITNSGTILGATSAGEADTLDGIYLNDTTLTSGITNSGTASYIQGNSYGIEITNGSSVAAIANSGSIAGGNMGVIISASTVGSILNSAGGTISGGDTGLGIQAGSSVTTLVNQGVITGGELGVGVRGTLGTFSNSGTVTGGDAGVGIYDSATVGSVLNSGLINGRYTGVFVVTSQLGSLTNSGTIYGSNVGIDLEDEVTIAAGITNSGSISGAYYGGIILAGSSVTGGITNLSGGAISGASGIVLYDSQLDSISNQAGATITGVTGGCCEQKVGVGVYDGSTITGQILNAGVITGPGDGIAVEYSSTIAGGIVNSGLISGTTYAGIALNLTASIFGGISNLKLGTITGGMTGIDVSNNATLTGGITNSGLISGGATGVLVTNNSTLTGGIQNAGTITGGQNGIAISAGTQMSALTIFTGDIVNSGLISGTSVAGIAINAVSLGGAITNMAGGTITGGQTGISLTNASTVTGGLTNSGLIAGGKYAVYVDGTSSLGPITIAGNTAQFEGDVYAPASDVTVTTGSHYAATNVFDVNSFTVSQGSTVNLSNPASTAGAVNGITVANGFTNAGTVSVARGISGIINGAYTQTASGQYKLGASSAASYGVLAVNGTVDLPDAAKIYVDVAANNTLTNKEVLKGVITSTGLTASTFDVTDNLDLVSFTGKIDGNNVDLVTKVNALVLADVLANGNYNAAPLAKVLDEIIATGSNGPFASVIDDLAKLQTSQEVSRTVSEFLPLLSGASNVSSIGTLWQLDQVIQSRLDGNTGLSSGDDYVTDRGAWVKPFGTWGNQSDQGSAPGYTSNTGGIVLGADGAVSQEARVGLAFAYASSDITGKGAEGADENKVDMYQFVGYGSYALDPVTELNFQIDGGENQNSGHRSIPSFGSNAKSSYSSNTAHFGVGLGRSMPIDEQTVLTPSVRMDYTWVRSDSYSESGAGPLNLNVQSASVEQLLTSVDAKLVHKVTDYASVFGNLGVGYDSLARNNTQIISAFAGAPGLPFATEGVGLKPWTVLAGFGVVATPQGGPEITMRYDLQNRSSFTEQTFSVKARWAF